MQTLLSPNHLPSPARRQASIRPLCQLSRKVSRRSGQRTGNMEARLGHPSSLFLLGNHDGVSRPVAAQLVFLSLSLCLALSLGNSQPVV